MTAPMSPHPNAGRMLRGALVITLALAGPQAFAADPDKLLRVASPDIETLDPQQYNDDPSYQVLVAIFEPLYEWDYLARSPRLSPVTASGPIDISADGRQWTVRVKPGIYFTDDPAFKGRRRELVAEDYVYSIKRWIDPNLRRGGASFVTDLIEGARAVVDAAAKPGARFDYDLPIAGLQALDRYTVRFRLTEANYPVIQDPLAFVGAVAREVVEAAGADIRSRAVGTGPYRLREWKRGSRLVLEANPDYRALAFPTDGSSEHAALVRSMQGKSLPAIGVVEVNIIDEDLTRLLDFERGGLDFINLRGDVATRLLDQGGLKADVAARGIRRVVEPEPYLFAFYFNIADKVIGGMSRERIALRRAMDLALDRGSLVDIVYAGQALPANQLVPPGVSGFDARAKPWPLHDPQAANALLDRFGYGHRDRDGFRRAPDGKPLTISLTLRTGGVSREVQTLWKKNMDAIGVRTDFHLTPFQDAIKELFAGNFQMYFGGFGGSPSGYNILSQLYGRTPPTRNPSRFKLGEFDRAFERFLATGSDSSQLAAAGEMNELAKSYGAIMPAVYRLENNYVQPWVQGFRPPVFSTYWKYLDIDLTRRRHAGR